MANSSAVDSTRLSEPDTEIYEGPTEASAAQEQKDFKFTWDVNVNEHSRLSNSRDLCKVFAGSMSLLKGTFKDSEVNRPVSSLKGTLSHKGHMPPTSSDHFPHNFSSSFDF